MACLFIPPSPYVAWVLWLRLPLERLQPAHIWKQASVRAKLVVEGFGNNEMTKVLYSLPVSL